MHIIESVAGHADGECLARGPCHALSNSSQVRIHHGSTAAVPNHAVDDLILESTRDGTHGRRRLHRDKVWPDSRCEISIVLAVVAGLSRQHNLALDASSILLRSE
jgi:hypothetical protein